jgi:hypothetical protein
LVGKDMIVTIIPSAPSDSENAKKKETANNKISTKTILKYNLPSMLCKTLIIAYNGKQISEAKVFYARQLHICSDV